MFEGEKEKLTQFWRELNRVATLIWINLMKFSPVFLFSAQAQ
jgi:hypothetical protein